MTKELKKLLDETEAMFPFLTKNQIKWIKSQIKIAYLKGKLSGLEYESTKN